MYAGVDSVGFSSVRPRLATACATCSRAVPAPGSCSLGGTASCGLGDIMGAGGAAAGKLGGGGAALWAGAGPSWECCSKVSPGGGGG